MSAEADRARTAAAQAADQIRTINHATQHSADFQVGDVYAIVADLAAIERRFQQAALQLAAVLTARLERGDLRHDTGGDVGDAVLTAHDRLGRAGDLAADAAQLLEQTQNALAPIADHGSWAGAAGAAADRESPCLAADTILREWSDLRCADIGRATVPPPEVLDR